jgi:hypothetical protein
MPTDRPTLTLFQAAKRAADVCDPDGDDPRVADLLAQFEDADEPITAIENLDERLAIALEGVDYEIDDPATSMAAATIRYLANRPDEAQGHPSHILQLAARAEWKGHPPTVVAEWLTERGVAR